MGRALYLLSFVIRNYLHLKYCFSSLALLLNKKNPQNNATNQILFSNYKKVLQLKINNITMAQVKAVTRTSKHSFSLSTKHRFFFFQKKYPGI